MIELLAVAVVGPLLLSLSFAGSLQLIFWACHYQPGVLTTLSMVISSCLIFCILAALGVQNLGGGR